MNTYEGRVPRKLDPDNTKQMDAFNEEYTKACEFLGVPRETMLVTWEQAAKYLGVSVKTILRYVYSKPNALLDSERVDGNTSMVVLDSLVERKLVPRLKSGPKTANS